MCLEVSHTTRHDCECIEADTRSGQLLKKVFSKRSFLLFFLKKRSWVTKLSVLSLQSKYFFLFGIFQILCQGSVV